MTILNAYTFVNVHCNTNDVTNWLEVPRDSSGFRRSFWMTSSWSPKRANRIKLSGNITCLTLVTIVPVHGLAPYCARTPTAAVMVMTKFVPVRMKTEARFINALLSTIPIRWKIRIAVIPLLATKSQQFFAHATIAQLYHCIRILVRVKRNFHRIWIAMKKTLVKQGWLKPLTVS